MPRLNRPGVFIHDLSAPPPNISDVETSVAAFVGYTQKAQRLQVNDALLTPIRITSLSEFTAVFGECAFEPLSVALQSRAAGFNPVKIQLPHPVYTLWYAIHQFFSNWGTECYVVSVGLHQQPAKITLQGESEDPQVPDFGLLEGLKALEEQDSAALLVIPESVSLPESEYQCLTEAMLLHCEENKRFALIDVFRGDTTLDKTALGQVRALFGDRHLSYAASYYPHLTTTIPHQVSPDDSNISVSVDSADPVSLHHLASQDPAAYAYTKTLLSTQYVVLPPSAAVAGSISHVDREHGVWHAPANIELIDVIEPVINLTNAEHEALNVDPITGKSINAIRAFSGKGTLIWGARTLAGNDNQWRYIAVRRFCLMMEDAIHRGTQWAAFENNEATTWNRVKSIIEYYLTEKWRAGAIAGAKASEAFYVQCGLGETMTSDDVLNGRLMIEVGLAVLRPAEFVVLRISHRIPAR